MAESADDKNVDSAITRMRALLNELEGAQAKDVKDESGEDYGPKPGGRRTLQDAEDQAYIQVRAHQRARRQQTKAPGA